MESPICTATLEQRPRLAFALLRLTARAGELRSEADLSVILDACGAAIARRAPLLVLLDLRDARPPPLAHLRPLLHAIFAWLDAHARAWDERVQGLAMVLSGAIVRGVVAAAARLLQPPQPLLCCASVDEALDFLSTMRRARSYVKGGYARAAAAQPEREGAAALV